MDRLRRQGYVPLALGLYQGRVCELISYAYSEKNRDLIQIRLIIGDPSSMVTVDVEEVLTSTALVNRFQNASIWDDSFIVHMKNIILFMEQLHKQRCDEI